MKRLRLIAVLAVLTLLIAAVPLVSAANPAGLGNPTLLVRTTANPNASEIVADGITNGGVAGNGAAAFTVWFTVPSNVALADIQAAAGPAWLAQSCNFSTAMSAQPPIGGRNTVQLDGFCTTTASGPRVTGNNVLVATLTFSTTACNANPGGFQVDLTAEGENTSLFEPDGTPYIFPPAALTDGGACGAPTAVTMSGFDATTGSAAPFVASAWPLLAGAIAVAAGGAYALLRRKS
jgi:hypothetical protein